MSDKRKTYRHRNGIHGWAAKELIHTFWVGQRVVRSTDRRAYTDVVDEAGVVSALPTKDSRSLTVEVEPSGEERLWSPTECVPVRAFVERNRKRFVSVAKEHAATLASLDENGFQKGTP